MHSLLRNTAFVPAKLYLLYTWALQERESAINFRDEMQDREACKCQIKMHYFSFHISKLSRSYASERTVAVAQRLSNCQLFSKLSLVQQTRMLIHLRINTSLPESIVKRVNTLERTR